MCEYISQDNDFRSLTIDAKKWTAADDEGWTTVGDVLANTFTDAWLVTRGGVAIAEEYAWPMKPARRHMLFSVSKSIVSIVVGALADAGLLRVDDLVTTHVPALGKSGYAGATIRDLLDMRSGVKFSEEYLEDGSEIRRLFEAVDFAPRTPTSAHGIKDFLTGLTSEREHGSSFVYRGCETDVLAWVCENVVGRPFAVVASEFVWSRIGAAHAAQVCQDRWGGSIADGAISTTLRDLGRFGEMIARGGVNADGTRVVSEAWVDDIFAGGPDSAQVFAESASGQSYPGGMYRSQFWVPSASRDVVIGIGIHGQMLYIDRATQTVGVKLSSDPEPVSLAAQHGTLAMFEAITEAVPAEVVPRPHRRAREGGDPRAAHRCSPRRGPGPSRPPARRCRRRTGRCRDGESCRNRGVESRGGCGRGPSGRGRVGSRRTRRTPRRDRRRRSRRRRGNRRGNPAGNRPRRLRVLTARTGEGDRDRTHGDDGDRVRPGASRGPRPDPRRGSRSDACRGLRRQAQVSA